uniref:Uncharacterized protein n=1 Tax=viral metagenome TaxID=1070528 RepID=A0A6M3IPG8_9ZZZZ
MIIKFKLDEEKKHSRRYKATDDKSPIDTIYVKRFFSNGKNEIEIEIKEK